VGKVVEMVGGGAGGLRGSGWQETTGRQWKTSARTSQVQSTMCFAACVVSFSIPFSCHTAPFSNPPLVSGCQRGQYTRKKIVKKCSNGN